MVLVGRPEGKRPLGRPRRKWKDNSKTDLREIGWGCGLGSSGTGHSLVETVISLRFPYNAENVLCG
jgi:hypothetical protein